MLAMVMVAAFVVVSASVMLLGTRVDTASAAGGHPLALAYYYIWFDPTSWNRAKIDTPLAGRYSSDERSVMEKHVEMAKAAGLDGFIVSWKSTDKLDRRLAMLADVAEANDFKLVVIYQGLDFDRQPLPVSRIAADLDTFLTDFAPRPAFHLFPFPAVILSGSWEYSADDIATLGNGRRDRMLLLASEKTPDGVQRLSGLIDGDAYYWSSVNPDTFPNYQDKLDAMSAAVHDDRRSLDLTGRGGIRRPAGRWLEHRRPCRRADADHGVPCRRSPRRPMRSGSSAGTSSARTPTSSRAGSTGPKRSRPLRRCSEERPRRPMRGRWTPASRAIADRVRVRRPP